MSDIAKKYQHYFNESVKLQQLVNEQAAYIEELENAILELSEDTMTPEGEEWAKNRRERLVKKQLEIGNATRKGATHPLHIKAAMDVAAHDDRVEAMRKDPKNVFGADGRRQAPWHEIGGAHADPAKKAAFTALRVHDEGEAATARLSPNDPRRAMWEKNRAARDAAKAAAEKTLG